MRALEQPTGGATAVESQEPLMADLHEYGTRSRAKLETCHDELVLVMAEALKMTPDSIDITIVQGIPFFPLRSVM